jgi:peptide chain release factor 2
MLDLDENLRTLNELKSKLQILEDTIKISNLREELKKLQDESSNENFWQDAQKSSIVYSKIKVIQKKIENFQNIQEELENLIELNSLLSEEKDETLESELESSTNKLTKDLEDLQIETLFSGKYDSNNAIITLHPGAGGTESQDWVEMLYRMYTRWSTANGFSVKELDYLDGDEAGIKSVTALISGENAYGYLKGEMGVHRLVRISPFDSGGRRHTSFASLEVLPEINDDIEININPDDLRIDTYRASGAGGQHINKTDSAVRITHIPTNIVVSCQSERSQQMNKETAMTMLKSKLINLKEKENKQTIDELKGDQKDIAWGSQIRSYVFCPYTMVKDHRTNYEVGNVQGVMDGDLNEFMIEYLKYIHENKI